MSLLKIQHLSSTRLNLIKLHAFKLFSLTFFIFTTSCLASDTSVLTSVDRAIKPDSALDSEGNPLLIPTETRSALEYSQPASANYSLPKNKKPKKPKRKKALSRKQQIASRANVANDPSCRWLNSRMDQLERTLASSSKNTRYGHHSDELKIRHSEWKCMKCGAEGPRQSDHDRCQYRR